MTRDVHGNGIPNGNGNPMGIPWEWKTRNWEWEWEGMARGNHLDGNGNYLHSHGNLFQQIFFAVFSLLTCLN